MSKEQVIITVVVLAAAVLLTRFLPFAIFKDEKKIPKVIEYLGSVLPAAMMGLLVVYCLKDYGFENVYELLAAFFSIAVVVVLQLVKHKTILSIVVGTAIYMILVNFIV